MNPALGQDSGHHLSYQCLGGTQGFGDFPPLHLVDSHLACVAGGLVGALRCSLSRLRGFGIFTLPARPPATRANSHLAGPLPTLHSSTPAPHFFHSLAFYAKLFLVYLHRLFTASLFSQIIVAASELELSAKRERWGRGRGRRKLVRPLPTPYPLALHARC